MKTQRFAIALTVINFVILIFTLIHSRPATAEGVAPVLRTRELQIVDEKGKVRASIQVHPANPTFKMPNGKVGVPDTAIIRLIDLNGRPAVKIWASDQGAGLFFMGDSEATQVWLGAEGSDSSLKLTNRERREQLIKP